MSAEENTTTPVGRIAQGCFGSCFSILGFIGLLLGIWYLVAGYCIDGPCTDRTSTGPVIIMIGAGLTWAGIALLKRLSSKKKDEN